MTLAPSPAPEIVTFGCRLNLAESQRIADLAGAAGLGDAVIVNTCAVTAEAERQARQTIRRLARQRPGARIIVTGCAAQIHPDRFADMPEVEQVVGNAEKLRVETWTPSARPRVDVADIMRNHDTARHMVAGFADQTRAFVEIQQGCDHRCTFCIIPFARGPSRSLPPDSLVGQARTLTAAGYREIVLTGVDTTAYGVDLPGRPSFGALIGRLLAEVPGIERLRLSSLDPAEIDDETYRLFADQPRLMPHVHLSLQSGDDLILKRMKRRHSRTQALAAIARLRHARPDIAIGADLIAGFPTESEAMFANTLRLVDEGGLDLLHVFPFSPRPGTPAAKMPQLPGPEIRARAARLRAAGTAAVARFLSRFAGARAQVLVERGGRDGHSEHFARVVLDRPALPGSIVAADIGAARDGALAGTLAA
ncbi:MAG: tRNA (N(6)-L-threonylcarbamoyladenosine(37)-C(2))-methylthiotransferase MtaB [Rhodospirillales bacterium]|nr:tRNA (N(6)-L-threonylcarbamoyladenosine(37)-C(2))-methylthiotransferase MtaB [Rhodospirillales bacterium]